MLAPVGDRASERLILHEFAITVGNAPFAALVIAPIAVALIYACESAAPQSKPFGIGGGVGGMNAGAAAPRAVGSFAEVIFHRHRRMAADASYPPKNPCKMRLEVSMNARSWMWVAGLIALGCGGGGADNGAANAGTGAGDAGAIDSSMPNDGSGEPTSEPDGGGAGGASGAPDASTVFDSGTDDAAEPSNADAGSDAGAQPDAGTDCEWDIGTGLDNGKQNLNMCKVCEDDASCDAPTYIDNGDGTVTSSCCGLVWQQVVDEEGGDGSGQGSGRYQLAGAMEYCAGLTLAGGGWRLPTIEELHSLVVPGQTPKEPIIDRTAFPDTPPDYYWSSSTYIPTLSGSTYSYVWVCTFWHGTTTNGATHSLNYVRCVR